MESTLEATHTPDAHVVVAARNVNSKRKRFVPMRMSSDHCRNCKERKVKCNGERPACRKCRSSARDCKGFAIWEVQLDAPSQAGAVAPMPASVNEGATNLTQLISSFLAQQYPSFKLAAPAAGHSPDRSFLHGLVQSNAFSPMLRVAIETICLTHLANEGAIPSVVQQESYGRTLSLLRAALDDRKLKVSHPGRKDVVATSAALSLLPAPARSPGQGADELDIQAGVHLGGAGNYLLEHGPAALGGENKFNAGLLFNIHVHSLCVAFAQRKRVRWTRPEWRATEDFNFKVEPAPNFPAVARYHPGCDAEVPFVSCAFPPREFMITYLHDFPGLLERADNFVAAEINGTTRKYLECEFDDLVQRLNSMQEHSVEPISDNDLSRKPAFMKARDFDSFDPQIEEHAFMQTDTTFDEFYVFSDSDNGKSCAFIHIMCLLADCALLRVVYDGIAEKRMSLASADARLLEVERRAYWHASEICRCAFFYSLRTLSGAKYLHGLLCCTRNFFESCGAIEEMKWCQACAMATRRRVERLTSIYPPTVCRVMHFVANLPHGCRYKGISHA